jgi:hypothetical protein
MTRIATATGGKYRNAQDEAKLVEVFEEFSADLHDDGIDETSLKELAQATGGAYYPAREANKLTPLFEQVASQLQPSYTVTFVSRRANHDGTARGLSVRYGDFAVGNFSMTVHGLLTPQPNHWLYLGLLGLLGFLLAVPWAGRRLMQMTR